MDRRDARRDGTSLMAKTSDEKVSWTGVILGVQPRIRLMRSFDERAHSYLGYVLHVEGAVDDGERPFTVAVGKRAHEKHVFAIGQRLTGKGVLTGDLRTETADLYKVSAVKVLRQPAGEAASAPPYQDVCPSLPAYRERGHRRLSANTYSAKCFSCMWGAKMAVEIIVDHWKPDEKRYRTETFCYGPLSCPSYKAGPNRKVPGRRGMTYVEEDRGSMNKKSNTGRATSEERKTSRPE